MDENQLREQIITHFFKVFKDNEGNIFGAFKIGTTNITDNLINSNTTFTLKETETNISFSFLVYVDKKGKNSLQFEHVSEKVGICRTKFNKLIVIKNGKLKIEIGQGNFNGFEEDKEEILTAIVFSKSLKRNINLVLVKTKSKENVRINCISPPT